MLSSRSIHGETENLFRETARRFVSERVEPVFDDWERAGLVPRAFWLEAGKAGLLCPQVPPDYGGPGGDYLLCSIALEELSYATGAGGPASQLSVHSDICASYLLALGTEEQKCRWLPGMVSGEVMVGIAMTEPNAGSDLQRISTRALKHDDRYVLNGAKTFITNGQTADLFIVACMTAPGLGAKGMSLMLVESDRPGFQRGRKLDKMGHFSADTSELFFDDVEIPVENMLGAEGQGFAHMMAELPRERLSVAVNALAAAQRAHDVTLAYVRERQAFGQHIFDFQTTRHRLAELATELMVGWAFLDQCLVEHLAGTLGTAKASMAKLWTSELQGRMMDQCLQMYGGYGFMNETPISRMFRDARVQRIYGGTSEIMKEIIARSL